MEKHNQFDEVVFSEHSLLRFVQRTRKKYRKHIDACELCDCPICYELDSRAMAELRLNYDRIIRQASKRFFAGRQIDRRESEEHTIREAMKTSCYVRHSDMTFVVSVRDQPPVIATCYLDTYCKRHYRQNMWLSGNRKNK